MKSRKKIFTRLVGVLAVSTGMMTVSAAPAMAGNTSTYAEHLCNVNSSKGGGYQLERLKSLDGKKRYGTVYLFWSLKAEAFCAVTIKGDEYTQSRHYMEVSLSLGAYPKKDIGSYTRYAGPVYMRGYYHTCDYARGVAIIGDEHRDAWIPC